MTHIHKSVPRDDKTLYKLHLNVYCMLINFKNTLSIQGLFFKIELEIKFTAFLFLFFFFAIFFNSKIF